MAGKTTSKMIGLYISQALPTLFLAGLFVSPAVNFHKSEKVEFDIIREDEEVAVVIQDLSTGARVNSDDLYTNKEMTPPIYNEEGTFNSFDLIKRQAGNDPYAEADFQANAIVKAFRLFRKLEKKIRRAIELQAAQVLTTGKLTLKDQDGNSLYTIDFAPKTTHFVTVGTLWTANGNDPLADLSALAEVIRSDGLVDPDMLIMGDGAFNAFIKNADVKAQLDNRKMELSQIAPEFRGKGSTYQGYVWVGNYRFEIFTYNGRYKDVQTGVSTRYIPTNKVVMMSSKDTRLDLTFGAIPSIVPPDTRLLKFLPPRLQNEDGGMDLSTFAWITPDGRSLKVSAGTRPLTIPTAIDTYGCLTVLA